MAIKNQSRRVSNRRIPARRSRLAKRLPTPSSIQNSVNQHAVFGPVSTINTAPVAIGNSIHGAAPIIHPLKDGVRVQGRDFMFQVAATRTGITDWVLSGGCPLVPHAFVASTLRSYAGMYAEFAIHGFTFHFITGASTTSVGDIMFYVGKSRANALLDTSNPNFMSVVLSDPNTCIGPLWKNASATYVPVFKTYSTDIFNDEDLRSEGPGELFMYTKNSAAATQGSPGYIVVDFDITFKTLQVNIRELTFPMNRLKYNQYGFGYNIPVAFAQGGEAVMQTRGALLDGSFSSITSDPAIKLGDVFKLVFVNAAAQYTAVGPSNLLQYGIRQGAETSIGIIGFTIDDGFTCFGVYMNAGSDGIVMLYPTVAAAMTQQYPLEWGSTQTVASFNIPVWASCIGNTVGRLYQSNF